MPNVDDFTEEKQCVYKDETYIARDNGAIMRLSCKNKKNRSLDNIWTFGKLDSKTGYLLIASERVHRIVATAFHRKTENAELLVDHIDTNRQNNRPENLRWVTKLENTLLNPITRKRIEYACGVDIYTFLKNPAKYRDKFSDPSYAWMKAVTQEEANASLERLLSWAKKPNTKPSGNAINETIFEIIDKNNFIEKEDKNFEDNFIASITEGAVQRDWRTSTEFLCCPQNISNEPIKTYANNLEIGKVFSRNQYGESLVNNVAFVEEKNTLYVITEQVDGFKPYALAEITYENNLFVHTSMGTYLSLSGAEKQFTLAQGLEWSGEDSIDDYC